jgi:hypothetical protein
MTDGHSGERGDAAWPVRLRGVTETVVTTRGPAGRYNVAALGIHAPTDGPATARTWGRTRTLRNFERHGTGHVQFIRDPVVFVDAALGVVEREHPTLDCAAATVEVAVEALDSGQEGDTEWVDWSVEPVETTVRAESVPVINRGFAAVVEATVATSRLGVATYDDADLRDRIEYFEGVVERCGGPAEREAFAKLRTYIEE